MIEGVISGAGALIAASIGGLAAVTIGAGRTNPDGDRHPVPSRSASQAAGCVPGHADMTFGNRGWAPVPVGDRAELAAVMPDGRIAVLVRSGSSYSYQLTWLTPEGAPAPDVQPARIHSESGRVTQVAQALPDGEDRLLLATAVGRAPAFSRPALLRRLADGRPDKAFGRAGTVTLGRANGIRYGAFRSVSVLADGRLIAVGTADGRLLMARFSSSGRLDRTFGARGVAIVPRSRRDRTETAVNVTVLRDQSLLTSGDTRRRLNEYYDEVRLLVARADRHGTLLHRAFGRTDLEVSGRVVGHAAQPDGAWVIADKEDGRVVLTHVDRRGGLGGAGAASEVRRRLGKAEDGSIAGGAALPGGGLLVAGTLWPIVDITFPNGDMTSDRHETPIVSAFRPDARHEPSECSDQPALPEGAWAAEFTSATAIPGGLVIAGWTRAPREYDPDFTEGRPPTSPIVFRARTP